MSHHLQDMQLAGDTLDICHVLDLILLQDFNCHGLACELVSPFLDFPEGALADCLPSSGDHYSTR